MIPKPTKTLQSRLESRLTDLASAKFGTFHESLRLFFQYFDDEKRLATLREKLAIALPAEEAVINRYLVNDEVAFSPENEIQAAAIGEAFLRMIADQDELPRGIYDQVYFRDNRHMDRLPTQSANDERSLEAVKDRFLRPFRSFVLDELESSGDSEDLSTADPADYDEGTGLLRKAVFERDKETFCQRALRENSPLSLVIIDLDNFKKINDTHLHSTGDEVLRDFSTVIRTIFKDRGTAYRIGGDEFSVLLPNHTATEATVLAERFRLTIEKETVSTKNLGVTASIGVAEQNASAINTSELVDQADKAMYEAKQLGRNLVRMFGESLLPEETKERAAASRKQPSAQGPFDDVTRESIRQNFFQSGVARCPFDSAKLEVDVYRIDEKKTADLQVTCPMCGVHDFLQGPE